MTGHDDFDRKLAGWFEADALAPAPAGRFDEILDATRRRRPRPAWLAGPGSHWVGEAPDAGSNSGVRLVPGLGLHWSTAFILLLVIVGLVGGAIFVAARLVEPSPLPTGRLGHLAYGLDGDIYVADWDGGRPVRIADGLPDESQTAGQSFWGERSIWSPDGRHLAYRSGGGLDACCGTIYISDPAGHVVATVPGTGWLVSWSPDSTRVATSVELGHSFGIYGLDGVRQALLTVPHGYRVQGDYSPIWSPDGMSLLMPIAPASSGPSEIWEFPIDGATPRRVPSGDPRSHRETSYSSDGARLAFIAYPDSELLVIANADRTELRVLPGAVIAASGEQQGPSYWSPVVSPAGDRVAFIWSPSSVADQTSDPSSSIYELRVVDVASGAVTTLARRTGVIPLYPIKFSPEGDRILFSGSDGTDVGASLWSVDIDGSDPQQLVTGTGWGDWQPLPAGP